jgi:hypothetical protein
MMHDVNVTLNQYSSAQAAINMQSLLTSKFNSNLWNQPGTCYITGIALYGTGTWTLREVDKKYVENFQMYCWRKMEISWTDRVRNEV